MIGPWKGKHSATDAQMLFPTAELEPGPTSKQYFQEDGTRFKRWPKEARARGWIKRDPRDFLSPILPTPPKGKRPSVPRRQLLGAKSLHHSPLEHSGVFSDVQLIIVYPLDNAHIEHLLTSIALASIFQDQA